MHPTLTGLFLAAILAGPLAAQDSTPAPRHRPRSPYHKVTISPVGGVNFATWGGKDTGPGATRRTGLHAGVMITAGISRLMAFEAGALYSQEGTGVDVPGSTVVGGINVDYIRVPVLLKARATLQELPVHPYLVAGSAFGFKVKCEVEARSGTQSSTVQCDDPALGLNLTSLDIGLVLGAGVDIGRLTVGLRYQPGLRSIDDTSNEPSDVHNTLLALTAGFAF